MTALADIFLTLIAACIAAGVGALGYNVYHQKHKKDMHLQSVCIIVLVVIEIVIILHR